MTVLEIVTANPSLIIPFALIFGLPIGLILYGLIKFLPDDRRINRSEKQ